MSGQTRNPKVSPCFLDFEKKCLLFFFKSWWPLKSWASLMLLYVPLMFLPLLFCFCQESLDLKVLISCLLALKGRLSDFTEYNDQQCHYDHANFTWR